MYDETDSIINLSNVYGLHPSLLTSFPEYVH